MHKYSKVNELYLQVPKIAITVSGFSSDVHSRGAGILILNIPLTTAAL